MDILCSPLGRLLSKRMNVHSARHQGPVDTFGMIRSSYAGEHQACIAIIRCVIDGAIILFSSLTQLSCIVYSSCMVKERSVRHLAVGLLDQLSSIYTARDAPASRVRGSEAVSSLRTGSSCRHHAQPLEFCRRTLRIEVDCMEHLDMDVILPDTAIDLLCSRTIHVWYFSTNCRR